MQLEPRTRSSYSRDRAPCDGTDGDLDIVLGNSAEVVVTATGPPNQWLRNDGSGGFTTIALPNPKPDDGMEYNADTEALALADVDGDGDLDIFIADRLPVSSFACETNTPPDCNLLLINDGSGGFARGTAPGGSSKTVAVAFGDVDGDGDYDLLTGGDGGANEVLLNDGTGIFSSARSFLGGKSNAVALGDMDGDGDLDAVVGNGNSQANDLLVYTRCPASGAQLHAASACFGCPTFMGRHDSSVCVECLPDKESEGKLSGSERCNLPCNLGRRPHGSDSCTACNEVSGTFYVSSLTTFYNFDSERSASNATTWTAERCVACESGKYADATGAACLPCLPGQYSASTGSTNCTPCSAGTFSSQVSSTACESCAVGGFCASIGAASASVTFEQCHGAQHLAHQRPRPPAPTSSLNTHPACGSWHLQPGHGGLKQQLVPRMRGRQGQPRLGQQQRICLPFVQQGHGGQ